MQLALDPTEAPSTFDVWLAQLAAVNALAAIAPRLVELPDEEVIVRLRTDLLGEGGLDLGSVAAVGHMATKNGGVESRVELTEARAVFEPGETMTSVGPYSIAASVQPQGVALFTSTMVSTSRGRELTCLTTAFLVDAGIGAMQSLAIARTHLRRGPAVFRFRRS
ncbi:MAG: hypothetical protein U1E73_05230 [Planctomycetota bacterium]